MDEEWEDEPIGRQHRKGNHPFFTGPGSGKQNYKWCRTKAGYKESYGYCDRRLRPHCYDKYGYNKETKECRKPLTWKDEIPFPDKTKMKWRNRRKYRKRQYRKKRRVARRALSIPEILPDYKEIVVMQQIVTAVQNEKQHIFGSQMSLWTPYDIETYAAVNPSANESKKILLKKGRLLLGLTNFAPNPVVITLWEFTPRDDGYNGKTPTEVYRQGITDISGNATGYYNPMSTPYWSKMFCQTFKIKRLDVIRLENGEEKTVVLKKNLNKIFSTEKLTSPGTTTFTPVIDTNWLKGITTYYGMSFLGGVHDVTAAGTGGTVGVGYGPVRVGVMTQKNYTTQTLTGSVTIDQVIIPVTTGLGFAGPTTGEGKIQNEDTGTSLATITAGAVANQA